MGKKWPRPSIPDTGEAYINVQNEVIFGKNEQSGLRTFKMFAGWIKSIYQVVMHLLFYLVIYSEMHVLFGINI